MKMKMETKEIEYCFFGAHQINLKPMLYGTNS